MTDDAPARVRAPKTPERIARRQARRQAARAADRQQQSLREQMLQRFGRDAEERVADRRKPQTPTERDRILKQLGIEDRRRQDRRR